MPCKLQLRILRVVLPLGTRHTMQKALKHVTCGQRTPATWLLNMTNQCKLYYLPTTTPISIETCFYELSKLTPCHTNRIENSTKQKGIIKTHERSFSTRQSGQVGLVCGLRAISMRNISSPINFLLRYFYNRKKSTNKRMDEKWWWKTFGGEWVVCVIMWKLTESISAQVNVSININMDIESMRHVCGMGHLRCKAKAHQLYWFFHEIFDCQMPNNDKYVHLFRVMNALDLQKTIGNDSTAIANRSLRAFNYRECERQLHKMKRQRIEENWTEEHGEKKQENRNVENISCQCHWRGSEYSRILSSQKNDWNTNSKIFWFTTLDSWLHYYVSCEQL